MLQANEALKADLTTSGDANRGLQEALKNALDAVQCRRFSSGQFRKRQKSG